MRGISKVHCTNKKKDDKGLGGVESLKQETSWQRLYIFVFAVQLDMEKAELRICLFKGH